MRSRITLRRLAGLAALLVAGPVQAAELRQALPPSPYDILKTRDLETPVMDAVGLCVPSDLDPALDPILEQATAGEWNEARRMLADWARGLDRPDAGLVVLESLLVARKEDTRKRRLRAEDRLRTLLRDESLRAHRLCLRLELARLLLLLDRESEAAAQLRLAERVLEEEGGTAGPHDASSPRQEEIAFGRAEILYRTGRRFDAHLAYRKLAQSRQARLALAARLRLTDLSFDAGKAEEVTREYEAILPRAEAIGASLPGWALRAAEAAIDAGLASRGLRWIERFLESGPSRDSRDVAEIRLADLDVVFDDPLRARKRLAKVSGRRRGDAIGALAAVRAIDLGVSAGSPDQRVEVLLRALREQRRGVRRYALGVLMKELTHRDQLDGALAVATRLAYEGIDPVVTPGYESLLATLLERVVAERREKGECQPLIRALGGRYGILIERANAPEAFVEVGLCFEEMELPWLAATLYRTITRRFGALGAEEVALPLARSSIEIGEVALARRVATAALEQGSPDVIAWKAIVAEADFLEGRERAAARGLEEVLDAPGMGAHRGKLIRMLAGLIRRGEGVEHARFIAERVPGWLDEKDVPAGARAAMLDAAMRAAHALRHAERSEDAAALYRTVDRHAQPGALRSSARFWLGLSGEADARGEAAWGAEPEITLGSPWARVAIFEERFESLASSYGAVSGSAKGPVGR